MVNTSLPAPMFDSVDLMPEEQEEYCRILTDILYEGLVEYNTYREQPVCPTKSDWKSYKKHENIKFYRQRQASTPSRAMESVDHCAHRPVAILGLGTFPGDLDALMYGLCMPDRSSIMQAYKYASVEIEDAKILAVIDKPSPNQPYHSVTLQRLVKPMPKKLGCIVKSRVLEVLQATGILSLPDGSRVGYHILHSVDHPTMDDHLNKNMVPMRISHCSLFRQVGENTIDAHLRGFHEGAGQLLDEFIALSGAKSLQMCTKVVEVARNKKLLWLLRRREYEDRRRAFTVPMHDNPLANRRLCGTCGKRFNPLRWSRPCVLCELPTCSSCRVERSIIAALPPRNTQATKKTVCKRCVLKLGRESTYRIAREEVQAGRYETTSIYSDEWARMDQVQHSEWSGSDHCVGEGPNETILSSLRPSVPATLSLTSSRFTSSLLDYYRTELESPSVVSRSVSDVSKSSDDREWEEATAELEKMLECKEQIAGFEERQKMWLKLTEMRLMHIKEHYRDEDRLN